MVGSTLVLEGEGRVGEYVGGYADWLRQKPAPVARAAAAKAAEKAPEAEAAREAAQKSKRKLSYNETRELEELPQRIERLETRIAEIGAMMAEPSFYARESAAIVAVNDELASLQADLDLAYERWQALES